MKKIQLGVIGVGGRGLGFLQVLRDEYGAEVRVAGLAETNSVRLRVGLRQSSPDTAGFAEYREMLRIEDLDAVLVTTPDYLHEEHAVAVLNAGKHVFVDKPLATTVKGCLNILREARRSDRLLYMGFNMRFDAVVQRMRQLVADGAAGRVMHVEAQEFYSGGRTYMSRWNRLRKFSGGLWVHKGTHDFDVINALVGDKPARVCAFSSVSTFLPGKLPFTLKEGEKVGPRCGECPQARRCPDHFAATEESSGQEAIAEDGYARDACMYLTDKDTHDQGAAIVEFQGGQTAVHSEFFVTSISNRLYTVVGDRATIKGDLAACRVTVHPRWNQDVITHEIGRAEGGHGGADPLMMGNFLACVRGEAKPLSNVVDGVWAVAEGESSEISRAEKRVVEIRELLDPANPLLT